MANREKVKISKVVVTHTKFEFYCWEVMPSLIEAEHTSPLVITSTPYTDFPRFTKERDEILECIRQMKVSFDDIEDRQVLFVKLKNLLIGLRNKSTLTTQNFLRALNMCIDALDNIRSEHLNIEQLEALQFVLREIDENMDHDQANQFEEILFSSGLKPTPKLEGIAELYG